MLLKAFNVPGVTSTSFQKLIEKITPNPAKETPQLRNIQRDQETNSGVQWQQLLLGGYSRFQKTLAPKITFLEVNYFKRIWHCQKNGQLNCFLDQSVPAITFAVPISS